MTLPAMAPLLRDESSESREVAAAAEVEVRVDLVDELLDLLEVVPGVDKRAVSG